MEEEVVSRRSRRSRSTSKPPSTEIVVPSSTAAIGMQQEIFVKLTRLHKEMIVHSEGQVNEMTTSSTFVSQASSQSHAVHNDDVTVEIQNKQNSNQEAAVVKSVSHTTSKVVQKKAKQGSSVNGSPTKKTTKKRVVAATSSEQSQASTSSDSQEKSTTGTRRTRAVQQQVLMTPPKEDRARKFYESVQRGEVDVSQSVFMRFYKPLEEWWNYYPKTDNTYSPLSTCRYELAPGMMAMPNLSRRSIHSGQRSFTSSMSQRRSRIETQVDSDTEDWEQTRTSVLVQRRQTSMWQRITTTIWTVTTIIYAYTFGALFGTEARGITRHDHATRVPLLLRPIAWLVHLARQLTLLEVTMFSSLSKGERRNFLLALLLFLLLAVPAYVLYKGGSNTDEKGTEATGILAWLADAITQGLLLARDIIAAPLTWLTSAASSVLGWIVDIASAGVQLLYSFFSFAISPFMWFFMLFEYNQTEVRIVEEKHSMEMPAVINAPQMMYSAPELDVDAVALKIMESAMFRQWKEKVEANQKQESDSMSMTMLHELNLLKMSMGQSDGANSGHFQTLLGEIRNLRKQVRLLQFQQRGAIAVKQDCCDKFDDKVLALFAGLYGAGASMTPAEMSTHIRNKLADLDNLEAKISKLTAAFEASRAEAKTAETSGTAEVFSASDAHVLAIINAALAKYDADKTNMVDYALESSGGEILSTRCSENYDHGKGETFYFGLSWFSKEYRPNNPRTIIQPNVHPGECWAFKGATGYAVIKLSTVIKLTAVTMEHIPRSIVPNGSFASAPRDFSVWGLTTLNNPEPLFLGRFRYEDNNQPVQTFLVDVEHDSFHMVELRIESNHGHIEYTCVYRFRIHGVPS